MPDAKQIAQLSVAIMIGVALLPIFSSLSLSGAAVLDPAAGQTQTVDTTVMAVPDILSVDATKETGIALDGNGYVDADTQDLTTGSWSVCTAAELASGANSGATYTAYAHENASILLQYDAGQWMAYYQNATHDAKATLPAPSPSDGYVGVCGRYNHTTESVVVSNGSAVSSPVKMTSSADGRNISVNWTGRLDEVREFNSSLDNSSMLQFGSDPIEPLPNTNRTARLMLDEGSGSTTTIYFASVDGTLVNASWGDGVAKPGLDRGTDYALYEQPFRFKSLSGGYLVGAPVVYLSWTALPLNIGIASMISVMVVVLLIVGIANEVQKYTNV